MRIILVVQPDRVDFYQYFSRLQGVEWILLWYEKREQMKISPEDLPVKFSKVIFWNEYRTPAELIRKIQPDRIIFYETIDLREISLIVTAGARKVPTVYLDHGAASDVNTSVSRWKETTFQKHKLPYLINRFRKSFSDVVKSKFFYYSVTEGFRSGKSYLKYLSLPFKMLKAGSLQVIAENVFRERVPQTGVIFNEANSEEYFLYTGVPKEEIHITGVPFFDSYYRPHQIEKDYAVYIDHPYLEDKLLEWSPEFHRRIAMQINEFARGNKIHVYVKLHPRSSKFVWEQYQLDPEWISIIQLGDYTELFLEARIILGFSSSLMTGFLCAKKNVVLLGWHPSPHIFGADFSKTGLCHVSFTPEDLNTKFNYWKAHNLTMEDQVSYEAFLRRFNYPFDGKATERVFQAVTGRAQLPDVSKPIAKHHVS